MNETLKFGTFWDIIEEIGIEIPPIQRDYAQGREVAKVDKIRYQFLNSIINALDEGENLSLDFVYGKIHGIKNELEHARNKQAIQSLLNTLGDFASTVDLKLENVVVKDKSLSKLDFVYLTPLDGQQRLTTLFLFHWYISKRLNNIDALKLLSRFRYKTRKSSSAFLKLLTDTSTLIDFSFEKDIKQKKSEGLFFEGLKNNESFSMIWLADPTVRAMMVMLQEIHYKLQKEKNEVLEKYWKALTNGKLINFAFLDLKDFNLSDELYVKMNGRGKQLSSFENFKAWLFGVVEVEQLIDSDLWGTYEKKFDVDWNDLFWKFKDKGVYDIDNAYFNYFKKSLLIDAVKEVEIEKNSFKGDSQLTILINVIIENKDFDWENFKDEIYKTIKIQLQFLSFFDQNTQNKYIQSFANYFFGTPTNHNWQTTVKNYITYSFIKIKDRKLSEYLEKDFNQLDEYHRIILNLFDNTIIDNPNLYQLALKEIDQLNYKLSEKHYNIFDWVKGFEYSPKSVFTEQQILEEILKYRLMTDSSWKEYIIEAENLKYFERQLNFWFFKIGISINKPDFEESWLNDKDLKLNFQNVTRKINLMFDDSGINRKESFSDRIFERALLSRSDYLLTEKGYKCFGKNTSRDVSWKRLFFRDKCNEDTNTALKEIFNLDFNNVKKSFEQYISENLASYDIESWRIAFVENSELFNYLGNLKYIRDIENHGWVLIKDHYKTYIGEHYELFSLLFYLNKLKGATIEPFNKIDYYAAPKNSLEDFPCAYLEWNYNKHTYAIYVKFLDNKYQLIFFCRNTDEIECSIEKNLLNLGLKRDKNYMYIRFDESTECYSKILVIGQKLSTL